MTELEGLEAIRRTDYRLTADPAFADALRALGFGEAADFDALLAVAPRVAGGRGPQRVIALPDGTARLRLRTTRRGGVLARLLPQRSASARGVEGELALWRTLRARGVDLPTPIAAIGRRRGLAWETHFASLDHAHAVDGFDWLTTPRSAHSLRRGVEAAARALRRLHDAGAIHGDLNLRNLLIEPEGGGFRCLFVDLDRARLVARASPGARMRELMRLLRSALKSGLEDRLDTRLRARALAAYCGRDRALRAAMRACEGGEILRLRRHRLAWRLQRALASSVAAALLAFLVPGCGPGPHDGAGAVGATDAPRWSLLAVGDTGRYRERSALFEGQLAVADAMRREALRAPVDGVVLLGDNFYDYGLLRDELATRIGANLVRPYCHFLSLAGPRSAEVEADCPIPPDARRPVPFFAVLGNHDRERPESIALERDAVPEFLPGWRMSAGLAEVVEVRPGVSLVLFESELAIDDRAAIEAALVSAIRAAKGPWRILATHRPIATDDFGRPPRGGYPDYVRDAIEQAGRPVQLVLCGHHHNLQAFALGPPTPLLQIGAGSGSRAEPPLATGHPDLLHASLALGFARIDLVEGEREGGSDGDVPDRLVVSLFRVPSWPWLERLIGFELAARYVVDRAGRVVSPPREGASRPAS